MLGERFKLNGNCFLALLSTFGSVIGEPTAERIKHEIGTAYIQEGDEILEMEVHGHRCV